MQFILISFENNNITMIMITACIKSLVVKKSHTFLPLTKIKMNLTTNQHGLYIKTLPYYSPFVFLLFKMWIRKKEEHLF